MSCCASSGGKTAKERLIKGAVGSSRGTQSQHSEPTETRNLKAGISEPAEFCTNDTIESDKALMFCVAPGPADSE